MAVSIRGAKAAFKLELVAKSTNANDIHAFAVCQILLVLA
jgi:hypothetical protein